MMLLSCMYIYLHLDHLIRPVALNYQTQDKLLNDGNLKNDEYDTLTTTIPPGQEVLQTRYGLLHYDYLKCWTGLVIFFHPT